MIRILAALCLLPAGCATASASSFVTLPAVKTPLSRSIVMLGEEKASVQAPQPADMIPAPVLAATQPGLPVQEPVIISASVIVVGTPAKAETVASAPVRSQPTESLPVVVRGGLIGEAQIRPSLAEPREPAATSAPARRQPAPQAPTEPMAPAPAAPPPQPTRQPE